MKPGTEQLESIPPVEQAVAEAAEATPRKPSRVKRVIARVRRSRWLRLGIALAVVGVVLFGLAYGVLRVLGPKEKFAPLDLPYVQHFADMDPRKWFISDGVWSLRQEMLAQAANLNKPADIYIPGQIVKEQPYHLSTYITFTKSTQEAGVNFNAQYPKMTTQQHQVFVARRSEDAGSDSATAADAPAMELVAGYTDENGEFVRQVTVPFDIDSEEYRLDVYVLGNTYTVQLNGQTMIERRPLFFPNGLVGYHTLGPARFDTLKITTAETKEPGEKIYISDFDQQPAGAGWVPFSGEWEIADGELFQANPAVQDAAIGYEGSAFEDYVIQATFHHLTGSGGGLLFNMVSPYQLNDAHVVRYSEQTDSIFWGFFDAEGIFERQGFVDVPPPGKDMHQLRVYVGADSYDVYLEDLLLARGVPLHQPVDAIEPGRVGGHIGLITSRSTVAYSLVEVFPLLGNATVLNVRAPEETAATESPAPADTAAAAAPATFTPVPTAEPAVDAGAIATPTPAAAATQELVPTPTPTARLTATPLAATSKSILQGDAAAWTAAFRGDLRTAGWRPIAGQWRFRNDSLVQEDPAGFDLAIAYAANAFQNYDLTASFSHRDGNGAGVLFNMPYTDRLNGAHMVRYSDRRPGGIFWGYFDDSGKFVGQGYANVSPPGDARHTLRVVSDETTYSIYLDDFLVASDLPLQQNYGYVGLVAVQSSVDYDSVAVGGASATATGDTTPIAVQPLAAAGIYSGTQGFPDQRIVSGKWEIADGLYRQTVPDVADYVLNTGIYASEYTIEADVMLPQKPDAGGGFMVQMPERGRKAGATVVRLINGGQGIFWGVYDESGAFRGRGSVELPQKFEGETGYRLKAVVKGNTMDVWVDDEQIGADIVLPRTQGWVSLVAFGGPIAFDNISIDVGETP